MNDPAITAVASAVAACFGVVGAMLTGQAKQRRASHKHSPGSLLLEERRQLDTEEREWRLFVLGQLTRCEAENVRLRGVCANLENELEAVTRHLLLLEEGVRPVRRPPRAVPPDDGA